MPPVESAGPLNAAHQHAANADDYIAQGLLIPAAEEHRKAAEAFATCVEHSSDENAKRTIRMLQNEHARSAKELERKIAKLREDGADPSLPQKSTPPRTRASAPQNAPVTSMRIPPPTSPSPPPQGRQWNRMSESQGGVGDESFMVLGARSTSDPGDAFNTFWKIMERMQDRLSQPVAFASAPLDHPKPPPPATTTTSSSDTDADDYSDARRGKASRDNRNKLHPGVSQFPPPRMQYTVDLKSELDEVLADDDDDLAESFCVIPSSEPRQSSASQALQKENEALKAELESTKKRLAAQEQALKLRVEQDKELRDSIVMAKREVQRAMASSALLPPRQQPAPPAIPPPPSAAQLGGDLAALNIAPIPAMPNAIIPGPAQGQARDRENQLLRRVRELEEEVRVLKADNEKQKAMIVRFREKWEKLKENSKKKKSARAAAEAESRSGSVKERIEEDPEAEAAAAEMDGSGPNV